MLLQSQRDPAWAFKTLGKSFLTMNSYGCTLTSVANSLGVTVDEALSRIQFSDSQHPAGAGLLIWGSVKDFNGYSFAKRVRGFDKQAISDVIKDPNKKVILEVQLPQSPNIRHWVSLENLVWGGYNTIDPYPVSGDMSQAVKKFYPFSKVLGHAEFQKTKTN